MTVRPRETTWAVTCIAVRTGRLRTMWHVLMGLSFARAAPRCASLMTIVMIGIMRYNGDGRNQYSEFIRTFPWVIGE
jgi:hypothetical protein